jgi:hypothetical protein
MRKIIFILFLLILQLPCYSQLTTTYFLSGKDKDNTVPWDFYCTRGMNSGKWMKIPVPSNWELQGFGTYNYGRDVINPDEQGLYKHNFRVPRKEKGKRIFIVFEGSMTDTEVRINGSPAGPAHQGGFYQFKYDITDLIDFEKENLLEVTVSKLSANHSVNKAERTSDFWIFGGIFRPVYLEVVPLVFIKSLAIDAKANGDFQVHVESNTNAKHTIEMQLLSVRGERIGQPVKFMPGDTILSHRFNGIKTWNPEDPNLYQVSVSIKNGNKLIHSVKERFGFRSIELKSDGIYNNGVKIIFKGVNRHSAWPTSGRTLSRSIHLLDINLMKAMNMNAVRMSHYPPDKEFLDLCDSLGLFVLDELTGWQAAYDTTVGRKLVEELVVRDVNHPSVIIWDNGNEGGWNRALDDDYALYDPQKRPVIHPWEKFRGTNTKHYPDFRYIQNEIATGQNVFFPTEFMHGLFDGGHGAGLDDFWKELLPYQKFAGGFLWSFHDEGMVRTDKNGWIDLAGNLAPDGIVGPYREKEGSFYTIKEIWSPVYINTSTYPESFKKIQVENRFMYTNLDQCRFEWHTDNFSKPGRKPAHKLIKKGTIQNFVLSPGDTGWLNIPVTGLDGDALYLSVLNKNGDTICTWSWPLKTPAQLNSKFATIGKSAPVSVKQLDSVLTVSCDRIQYYFDRQTGFLRKVFNGKADISLSNGPRMASGNSKLVDLKWHAQGNETVIEPQYENDSLTIRWTFQSGKLPVLSYKYVLRDSADFNGITFNFPEEKISGMKWLGRGPYHVWKNRMKGQQLNVWSKAYNNTVTGESWIYPEFKGWHAELYWVQVQNSEANFTVYTESQNIFLEMLAPQKPKAANNDNTAPTFPMGNIGFMNSISPIGTKFQRADLMGPESKKNIIQGNFSVSGTLYFDFQ